MWSPLWWLQHLGSVQISVPNVAPTDSGWSRILERLYGKTYPGVVARVQKNVVFWKCTRAERADIYGGFQEQIGNHLSLSQKIQITHAEGCGQGSWLSSQVCAQGSPRPLRPHVIFSGDYNLPNLSLRKTRAPLPVWWNTIPSRPFCLDIFFALTDVALGLCFVLDAFSFFFCFLYFQNASLSPYDWKYYLSGDIRC